MDSGYAALARAIFTPATIAVVGAGENPDSLGSRRLRAIADFGYQGRLCAVNRSAAPSGPAQGYRSLRDIGGVDYVIAAARYEYCPAILDDAEAAGVPAVHILSTPPPGTSPRQVREQLGIGRRRTRVIGPNSVGIHSCSGQFSFLPEARREGNVALLSQSGGITVDALRQATDMRLGIGCAVSMGNGADLGAVDFLQMFALDEGISAIGCYLEGTDAGAALAEAIAGLTARRPVFVLRGGNTGAGRSAVMSHTGSLTTDDTVWGDVLRAAGAIEARSLDELLTLLAISATQAGRTPGRRCLLIGNGGGIGVLAADRLERCGLGLARLAENTQDQLAGLGIPAGATLGNPTDVPGGALAAGAAASLADAAKIMACDENVDVTLLHFNLGSFAGYRNSPDLVASVVAVVESACESGKPTFVCLRSTYSPEYAELARPILDFCELRGVTCGRSLDLTIDALGLLAAAPQPARCPVAKPPVTDPALARIRALVQAEAAAGHTLASQALCWEIMDLLEIEHPATAIAATAVDAVALAGSLRYPVAVKIDSPDIVHKSDVGAVRLGVGSPDALAATVADFEQKRLREGFRLRGYLLQAMESQAPYECLAAARRDAVFGGIVLAGAGGIYTELWDDSQIRIAPVLEEEAEEMWRELRYGRVLAGYRGQPPGDVASLAKLTAKIGKLVQEPLGVEVVELNPVRVRRSGHGLAVVDCRIIFSDQEGG